MSERDTSPETAEKSTPVSTKKKAGKRRFLLALGPVLVATVSLYVYWTGGRVIQTDNAYIQADKTPISAEVTGAIVEVLVKENQLVEKGSPLLKIDPRSYVITLEKAKANLQNMEAEINKLKASYQQITNELSLAQNNIDYTEKEYKRLTKLDSNNAVAKAQLDSAQHNFQISQHRLEIIKAQRAQILAQLEGNPDIDPSQLAIYRLANTQVENAALDLDKTVVRAPFQGRVSKIPQPGKHVAPGMSVMSLIADNDFWIEANLKETDLTHVSSGQKVDIEVDTYPDADFTGTVQSISPGTGSEFSILPAQNATGNWVKVVQRIPVRIKIDESVNHQKLCAGMSATVKIDTKYHRTLPSWARQGFAKFGISTDAVASMPESK